MKWIQYQIFQNANGEEVVLANKKVGYNAENLAIAQKEAYDGYEIVDDEQSFEKEPLAIEFGGTGANDAEGALQKLGAAPVDHASNDTTYGKGATSIYGHVKLSDSTSSSLNSNSGTAATPAAVKKAYDLAYSKAPAYSYGTTDMVAGTSELETGKLYFVYE